MSNPIHVLDFERPLAEMEKMIRELRSHHARHDLDVEDEIRRLERRVEQLRQDIHSGLSPWQRVQLARHPSRPYALDYVATLCSEFEELHGDRRSADDQALIGGFAKLGGRRIMLVAHQKGRDTKERARRNFGMAGPEGYRKALRLMQMADKFNLPIVTMVDTPGAYPGVQAEERHIAEAISVNLREMFQLRVPIVSVIIGEGGSGGALGIAVADRVLILENAYYSVISPEGCAAILWKDRAHAPRAAEALRITAQELKKFGLVDEIVEEPVGGAHYATEEMAKRLGDAIETNLGQLSKVKPEKLMALRLEKFRKLGQILEN
jgi:acetyl-CoA carboxylase carboxyl transferase subunit alpha